MTDPYVDPQQDHLRMCPKCKTFRHRTQFMTQGFWHPNECDPCRQPVRDVSEGLKKGIYAESEVVTLLDRWGEIISQKPADPRIRPQFDPNVEPEIVPDLKGLPDEDE